MALKVPTDAALLLLADLITAFGAVYEIHLFQNNHTPADGDTTGAYTDATYTGYGPATIATWTGPTTVSGRATTYGPATVFVVGAVGVGNSIYGYYILDGGGALRWAERDAAAPIDMTTTGRTYTVTPVLTLKSEF